MPVTQETLLTVLLIALAANLVLMVLVIIAAWIRGRRRSVDEAAPITVSPSAAEIARRTGSEPADAPNHEPSTQAPGPATPTAVAPGPPASTPSAAEPLPDWALRASDADGGFPASGEPADDDGHDRDADHDAAGSTLIDPATGLDSPRLWSRTLADEMARIARYRRPASIVLIEVEGLERLVDRFGQAAADRLLPVISDTIRKNARAADHVAVLERGRYGVLLTETDEVRAINYIERVRTACDGWLAAGAVTLRLAIGWADANAGRSIDDALDAAQDRLDADRRRAPARPGPDDAAPETGPADA